MRTVPALITSATLLLGCSGAEPGDLERLPTPSPQIAGSGRRLTEVNDPASPWHPPDGTEVDVTGISVLAVDEYDETGDGASAGNLYAQDLPVDGATPPHGGITLFDASFSPPTLRVAPGDVVDVRGTYDEFEGPSSAPFDCLDPKADPTTCARATLPEIVGGTVSLRFEFQPAEPITIPLSELGSYETGRKWIGILVRVENVKAQSDGYKSPSGRYSVRLDVAGVSDPKKLPTMTNALFDLESSGAPLTTGSSYASVVGVVQYFFNFSVAPRSAADIVP